MSTAANVHFFRAALLLPTLTVDEHHLLRTITHHYGLGTHEEWGSANAHRAAEVRQLFEKCIQGLRDHVSYSAV